MKRQAGYQWHLREVMAARGLFTTTDLVPRLADRGITLSASQVHRLVTGTPERLSLPVLAALCDILNVTPDDLITVTAEPVSTRKTAAARTTAVRDLDPVLRPVRARIRPQP
jgi:DNA-binding Xre family transcriptional regulator